MFFITIGKLTRPIEVYEAALQNSHLALRNLCLNQFFCLNLPYTTVK